MTGVGDVLDMPPGLWVSRVLVSPATATKLSAKHGLDADEVCDAVEGVRA